MIAALIASAVVSMSAPARAPATPAPVEEASVPSFPGRPDVPKRRRGRTEYPYRSDADYFNDFERVVRSDDIDSVIDNPGRPGLLRDSSRAVLTPVRRPCYNLVRRAESEHGCRTS